MISDSLCAVLTIPALGLVSLVAACASHTPPSDSSATPKETKAVTGTVAYRERIALPADAVIQVQLSDVSRQDAPAQVIAETTFTAAGRQVPFPFELRYHPDRIEPNHTYAVRATIRGEGRLLFTTDAAHHVITRGNPGEVSLMLVSAGGGTQPPPDAGDLSGTSWQLEDLGGAGVIDNSMATLEFPESGEGGRPGLVQSVFRQRGDQRRVDQVRAAGVHPDGLSRSRDESGEQVFPGAGGRRAVHPERRRAAGVRAGLRQAAAIHPHDAVVEAGYPRRYPAFATVTMYPGSSAPCPSLRRSTATWVSTVRLLTSSL